MGNDTVFKINWDSARHEINKNGFTIVPKLFSSLFIERFTQTIKSILLLRCESLGLKITECEDIDNLYSKLSEKNDEAIREVILLLRDSPIFYEAITSPKILEATQQLLKTDLVQVVHDVCLFRIDPPNDRRRSFEWHQDYPFNVLSQSALTVWMPLTKITEEMGPLRVVKGSHKKIRKMFLKHSNMQSSKGMGHTVFELAEPSVDEMEHQSFSLPSMNPGDVLFLNSCLLHRSGINNSLKSRWVCNLRYGDMRDEKLILRNFKVARDKSPYVFNEIHPDLVISK